MKHRHLVAPSLALVAGAGRRAAARVGRRQGTAADDGRHPHAAGADAAAAEPARLARPRRSRRSTRRIDEQTDANRKAFADQKLVIDNLPNDLRVIREKLDDNNVRVGSLTQEVDALRQSVQQLSVARGRRPTRADRLGRARRRRRRRPARRRRRPPLAVGASPQKLLRRARRPTTRPASTISRSLGFEAYIKSFPKSDAGRRRAGQHRQLRICRTGKYDKAVEAYDIADPQLSRTATRFPRRTTRRASRSRT